jgi:uncharacterized NAD(P)/FAD-binding protein YdhS
MADLPPDELAAWLDAVAAACGDRARLRRCLDDAPLEALRARARWDPTARTRTPIARSDRHEVVITGWMPGQSSAPHDHPGATCMLRVLDGALAERRWQPERGWFDDRIEAGVVADRSGGELHAPWLGAGAPGPVAAVHVYVPPLACHGDGDAVAVIGAGAAGLATAIQLRRLAGRRVTLFDPAPPGRGSGYTADPSLRLNVPADRMSLLPDLPTQFAQWALARKHIVHAGEFARRSDYAAYLDDLRDAYLPSDCLVAQAVTHIAPDAEGWRLHAGDRSLGSFGSVVFALGPGMPHALPRAAQTGDDARLVDKPLAPGALTHIPPDADVLVAGTGLSFLDCLAALDAAGHRGRVIAVSRHLALPLARLDYPADARSAALDWLAAHPHAGPRQWLAWVRSAAESADPASAQACADALRAHLTARWRGLSPAQQASALRHLRRPWEALRHRAPPEVRARADAALASGRLRLRRGRLVAVRAAGTRLRCEVMHASSTATIETDHVLNATGIRLDLAAHPPLADLATRGLALPHPTGLGLAVTPDGALLDAEGHVLQGLYAVGAMRQGDCAEATAIAEIAQQARDLALTIHASSKCAVATQVGLSRRLG